MTAGVTALPLGYPRALHARADAICSRVDTRASILRHLLRVQRLFLGNRRSAANLNPRLHASSVRWLSTTWHMRVHTAWAGEIFSLA
jgi:hypothetical protein